MRHLSTIPVCIRTYDPGNPQRWKLIYKSGDIVSAATALTLILRLRSADDALFAYLVSHAPPDVICQLAMHQGGGLITPQIVKTATEYITRTLARFTSQSKRRLSDAGGNLVFWFFRRNTKWANPTELSNELSNLINQTKDHVLKKELPKETPETSNNNMSPILEVIKKIAIVHGILVSGALKYVIWLEQQNTKNYNHAKLAIDVTLSIIGFAPAADKVTGLLIVIADAMLFHYWNDRSHGLRLAVQDFVTDAIYWQLIGAKKLPWYSEEGTLSKEEVDEYKGFFELVLRSNHF